MSEKTGSDPAGRFSVDLGPLLVPELVRPSYDAMYERFLRNFTHRGVPKAERPEAIDVDLVLEADEANRGGDVLVEIPIFARCAVCGGSGFDWLVACERCGGRGLLESKRALRLEVAPGTASGAILEASLAAQGAANFFLRLHVSVEH